MTEPAWLTAAIDKARAEGRIISETSMAGTVVYNQPTPTAKAVAECIRESGPARAYPRPTKAKPALTPVPVSRRSLTVVIAPLRLASEANAGGKLRDKIARKGLVKNSVREALMGIEVPVMIPVVVTLTRLGGKSLDDDNLARSMKSVRDVVAEWLGLDDADPKIRWRYRQRPAWVMGCKIHIREKR